jgi:cell division protease FtsH
MSSVVKKIIFWVVMIVTALLLWAVVRSGPSEKAVEYTFTQFSTKLNQGEVRDVTIWGIEVSGSLKKNNEKFRTIIPVNYPDLYKTLIDKGIAVNMKTANDKPAK